METRTMEEKSSLSVKLFITRVERISSLLLSFSFSHFPFWILKRKKRNLVNFGAHVLLLSASPQ